MKKYYFLAALFLLLCLSGFSQFQQVDETQEIFGIRLMSQVDYKQLAYYKIANDNSFNIYKIDNKKKFVGNDYTISNAYVIIRKNLVWDIILPFEDSLMEEKISHDLISSGFKQDFGFFDGKNIIADFLPFENGEAVWLYSHKSIDSIQNVKDNSGVVDLIGKKFSDESVKQFIASIPGKSEKREYEGGYELTAPGFYSQFQGNGDEAMLKTITIYLARDNYYYSKPAFKGSMTLPYDLTATTTEEQMTDMFGEKDKSDYNGEMNFRKFRIKAKFGKVYSKKTTEEERLIFLTIE